MIARNQRLVTNASRDSGQWSVRRDDLPGTRYDVAS